MYRMGGFGQYYKQTSDGTVVDCDLFSNFFASVCWNPFASQIPNSAVPALNPPPMPVPPPAPVATPGNLNPLTLPPSSGADATATINATLAQGQQNNQAAINAYVQNMQNQGAAAGACTSTLFPSLGICDKWFYVGGAALGIGVIALALTRGGR